MCRYVTETEHGLPFSIHIARNTVVPPLGPGVEREVLRFVALVVKKQILLSVVRLQVVINNIVDEPSAFIPTQGSSAISASKLVIREGTVEHVPVVKLNDGFPANIVIEQAVVDGFIIAVRS